MPRKKKPTQAVPVNTDQQIQDVLKFFLTMPRVVVKFVYEVAGDIGLARFGLERVQEIKADAKASVKVAAQPVSQPRKPKMATPPSASAPTPTTPTRKKRQAAAKSAGTQAAAAQTH